VSDCHTWPSEWVRNEACRTAAHSNLEHPAWGRFVMIVDVAATERSDVDLATSIAKTVVDSDLELAALLYFEITEHLLFSDAEAAVQRAARLGARLAVEAFGTGYSPPVHRNQFPIDAVTIDQVVVAGLGTDPFDNAIVDAVVDLSNRIDLEEPGEQDGDDRAGRCVNRVVYASGRVVDEAKRGG
jgi:EAL domain-containing protein (putative c-di-GMP-specific phosphodiesterase class I)